MTTALPLLAALAIGFALSTGDATEATTGSASRCFIVRFWPGARSDTAGFVLARATADSVLLGRFEDRRRPPAFVNGVPVDDVRPVAVYGQIAVLLDDGDGALAHLRRGDTIAIRIWPHGPDCRTFPPTWAHSVPPGEAFVLSARALPMDSSAGGFPTLSAERRRMGLLDDYHAAGQRSMRAYGAVRRREAASSATGAREGPPAPEVAGDAILTAREFFDLVRVLPRAGDARYPLRRAAALRQVEDLVSSRPGLMAVFPANEIVVEVRRQFAPRR